MSNSSLVNYTKLSPNCNSPRKAAIGKITIHHVAGIVSVETIGNIFAPRSRGASANYGIGNDGRIGLYVNESDRAWTSGSASNDNQAITIEVSNCEVGGQWKVSDAAYASLIKLCVDICRRNGIKQLNWTGDKNGNLTCHYMFQATACPGPYLKSKMPEIAAKVNAELAPAPAPTPTPTPGIVAGAAVALNNTNIYASATTNKSSGTKTGTFYIWSTEVINNRIRITNTKERVGVAGQVTGWVNLSDIGLASSAPSVAPTPAKKSNEEIAKEVLAGKWGNGADRKKRLTEAGYNYDAVQKIVDSLVPKPSAPAPTPLQNGNRVKFRSGASKWATGQTIPAWVKARVLYVRSKPANGKCLVSTVMSGAITGTAYVSDLVKV